MSVKVKKKLVVMMMRRRRMRKKRMLMMMTITMATMMMVMMMMTMLMMMTMMTMMIMICLFVKTNSSQRETPPPPCHTGILGPPQLYSFSYLWSVKGREEDLLSLIRNLIDGFSSVRLLCVTGAPSISDVGRAVWLCSAGRGDGSLSTVM